MTRESPAQGEELDEDEAASMEPWPLDQAKNRIGVGRRTAYRFNGALAFRPGESKRPACAAATTPSFNGALAFRPGKDDEKAGLIGRIKASMEPWFLDQGKLGKTKEIILYENWLQWGPGLSTRE